MISPNVTSNEDEKATRFGDPVLASIWQLAWRHQVKSNPLNNTHTHLLEAFNDRYAFYTIIGDTVNIGQRLEQLGKEVYSYGTEASILISGDTAAKLGPEFETVMAGRYKLTGRMGVVDVLKLVGTSGDRPGS